MILFKKLKYKNFLSTGDNFTTLDLTEHKTTLVVGQNGAGKSTMLDALSFVLFGKAHRNINKPQLINSINNKDCVVEVEFDAYDQSFKVVRGLKPNVFEIWKDDQMINQSSHAKEYQKILEQNILKLNHKSFHQIVVLGSSSFIPFMQLPAQHRRDVIEDLLDINVFSKMNILLKEKNASLKDRIVNNTHEIELIQTKINAQKKHICELTKISESAKSEKETELKEQQAELARLENLLDDTLEETVQTLEAELDKVSSKRSELEKYQFQFTSKIKKFEKDMMFYEDNDTCPTCDQEITGDTKDRKISESINAKAEIEKAEVQLQTQLESLTSTINDVQTKYLDEHSKLQNQSDQVRSITRIKNKIRSLQDEISQGGIDLGSLRSAHENLEALVSDKDVLSEAKLNLAEEREYNGVISELLKDSGIKTKVIKQYLPVINKLTNQYLQVLDFYVHFDLNEEFKESIRSRHRDDFSYDSFSEGEKQRIDLSLLFTWRTVAKMINSVATNLLILDETFDSSLDGEGVDNLLKILDTLDKETNVFVISHKGESMGDHFQNKIEFIKKKNFSKVA